jgi:transketolase
MSRAPASKRPSGVTGSILVSDTGGAASVATAPFGEALVKTGRDNPRVLGMSADLSKYTDMHLFAQAFPERFFQVGMAEQSLAGMAAGLARAGFIPFATTYCVFATRRAYDFIAIGAALGKANVKIIAGLPGLTTGYGGTHQGIEDLALMRAIPNMTVIDPCDATEIEQAVPIIAAHPGPVYMRLLRGSVPVVLDPATYQFELGKAKLLRPGKDVALISTGLMTARALEAAAQLAERRIDAAVLHVSTLKPFDAESVAALLKRVPRVVTIENHVVSGGLGSAVAEVAVRGGYAIRWKQVSLPDAFCVSGSIPYLAELYKMRSVDIAGAALSLFE